MCTLPGEKKAAWVYLRTLRTFKIARSPPILLKMFQDLLMLVPEQICQLFGKNNSPCLGTIISHGKYCQTLHAMNVLKPTVKLINWAKHRSCTVRHVQKQESSSRYELLKLAVLVGEASRHGTSRAPRACAAEHLRPRRGTAPPPAPLHRVAAIAFTSWLSPQW